MSTSSAHQQSLVNAVSETHTLMLERGSYIPWASRFRRDALKQYEVDIKAMNLILISVSNDIYNSVDSCQMAQEMWLRVERLMQGTALSVVDRETRNMRKLSLLLEQKKLEKTHDPLAIVAHTIPRRNIPNDPEDSLTIALMLLARAITQRYSTPTNNRLRSSSNTRNQAVVQVDRVNIQSRNVGNYGRNARCLYNIQEKSAEGSNVQKETRNVQRDLQTYSSENVTNVQCYNCNEKGHYCNCPKPRVWDSKYFMEQMLLAKKDEAAVILSNKQNDFLLADAAQMKELEELNANICMMARIQPTNIDFDEGPSYDSTFISELWNEGSSGCHGGLGLLIENEEDEETSGDHMEEFNGLRKV
ncbi:retrovirus-related pol polyprotein from transposon TNT 1-94 [Tanacetum coccineum]|uniref:Retrovirus-related pol polyprotein from transposon TNT 1-94 n=1 Tax=Tanacetum coccineum TaxID=301880 RepID=A0ABQ5FIG4_9ASTR